LKGLRALGGLVVSLGLLALLAVKLDLDSVLATLRETRWTWLLLAASLGPVQVVLAAERWRLASERLAAPLTRWEAWREYALSTFVNQVLPSGVAGDAARVTRQRHMGWQRALGAALVDRGAGQALLALVTLVGLICWPDRPPGSLLAAVLLVGVFSALFGLPGVRRALRGAWFANLVLSGTLLFSFLLGFAFCGVAIGRPLGLELGVAVPLMLLAMAIPLSVGGWGLREATAAVLLPSFGWSPEQAVALSTCYGLTVLAGSLPGALVPLWRTGA